MSDFLSNLADRNLGQSQTVQPRLPSLFEPWHVRGAAFAGLDKNPAPVVEEVREVPVEAARPVAMRPGPHALTRVEPGRHGPRADDAALTIEVPRPIERPVLPGSRPAARIEPEVAPARAADWAPHVEVRRPVEPPPAAVRRDRPEIQPRTSEVPPSAARPQPAASEPQRAPAVIPATPAPKHRQVAPTTIAREIPAPAVTPLREEPPEPVLRPRRTRAVAIELPFDTRETGVGERRTDAAPVRTSRVEPVVPVRAAASATSASVAALAAKIAPRPEGAKSVAAGARAASEPVIQVTIGRIEVRAIPQAQTAPKSRAASPVMSLSDYLQKTARRGSA